jgi:hypothetical protein
MVVVLLIAHYVKHLKYSDYEKYKNSSRHPDRHMRFWVRDSKYRQSDKGKGSQNGYGKGYGANTKPNS